MTVTAKRRFACTAQPLRHLLVDDVLSALVEKCARARLDRQRAGVDGHAHAAGLGDLLSGVQQPVAEVHAGRRGAVTAEMNAEREPRRRPKVAFNTH